MINAKDSLKHLAATRGYRVLSRGKKYWLIGMHNHLPESNDDCASLSFTHDQAELFLARLTSLH